MRLILRRDAEVSTVFLESGTEIEDKIRIVLSASRKFGNLPFIMDRLAHALGESDALLSANRPFPGPARTCVVY